MRQIIVDGSHQCVSFESHSLACIVGSVCAFSVPFFTRSACLGPQRRQRWERRRPLPPSVQRPRLPLYQRTSFLKTSGTKFTLNGAPYKLFRSNAYWLALVGYIATDINKAFADIAASGGTAVREITATHGVYFHLWSGKTATITPGAHGFDMLDAFIAAAKAHDIRLTITLYPSSRSDYDGRDVCTAQIVGSGQPHHVFYTNAAVIVS
ncbi:hypothetical protein B0H19DRAFT_1311691, partial [Mycena capillaripes]